MVEGTKIVSPFLRRGPDTNRMMLSMLACLSVTAMLFAYRYDAAFAWRYFALLGFSMIVEMLYVLLKDCRLRLPHASTAVTAALLILSVPGHMPLHQTAVGILVAVVFGKLIVDRNALRVNPMLLGRLFMMIVFAAPIQNWLKPGTSIDTITSATPLGFWLSEKTIYNPANFEGIYTLLPGSPGDVSLVLTLLFGVLLYFLGVLDWRPGAAFLAGFAVTCPLLDMPIAFHLVSGSVIFAAVYIVTDPRSMPGSKFGRLAAGFITGVLNALVRNHGYYPEGIVIAVLAANLLSPALDSMAFAVRGWLWKRQTT